MHDAQLQKEGVEEHDLINGNQSYLLTDYLNIRYLIYLRVMKVLVNLDVSECV